MDKKYNYATPLISLSLISITLLEFHRRNKIVKTARNQIGSSYCWGGETPGAFDCSGLINYVFSQNHIQLDRTVANLYNSALIVKFPLPGDLVFFKNDNNVASHIGIYIGRDKFIQSGFSTGVVVSDFSNNYWKHHFLAFGRMPGILKTLRI